MIYVKLLTFLLLVPLVSCRYRSFGEIGPDGTYRICLHALPKEWSAEND